MGRELAEFRDRLTVRAHLEALKLALMDLETELDRIDRWARRLARVLASGGRVLAAGNGGSAAHAQHFAAELVGRYRDDVRPALSAIALGAETAGYTAICNDFGAEEAFARQVRAHGRPGDVFVALTTSGSSANVLAALEAAIEHGLVTWALTGPRPNRAAELADDAISVACAYPPTVQEIQQVVIHLVCGIVEEELAG